MNRGEPQKRKRRSVSPMTRRILAINVLALGILVAGILYLDEYRQNLIAAELESLTVQADLVAAALGENAIVVETPDRISPPTQTLRPGAVRQMVRRLAEATGTRARLFATDGVLLADSRMLMGPGGTVQIEELPPPESQGGFLNKALGIYDRLASRIRGRPMPAPYREKARQSAQDYVEALRALSGETAGAVRSSGPGLILSVSVPVQRYKQVLGALMLSRDSHLIDDALYEVRLDILKVFLVALAITVLLSIYLAGTIARPIHRLAPAADRVRHGHHRQHSIPDFAGRNDEIGDLAVALSDMTEALWQRMDAIEGFAADVAHEIKNPLTSLRSAVETAARIKDPEQQRKLMSIIQEDVQRLDRLISDISDASRLDAELSRAEEEPVDLARMLATLADLHDVTGGGEAPKLHVSGDQECIVTGMEGRLVQVFRNLIGNAVTFSPPGGTIAIHVARYGGFTEITFDDEGPGIPTGKENAIFERFYSERPEGEKFGTHSGLGLSISRQIIEAHDGTLTAENRAGGDGRILGARFTVRLPIG